MKKSSNQIDDRYLLYNAVEGSRTLIQVIGHEPESCAYTNSATTASAENQQKLLYLMLQIKSMKIRNSKGKHHLKIFAKK